MTNDEARDRLERARARLRREDRHLLMIDVSERCIAARLAMYLQDYFRNYDVDVEYNRHGEDTKQLQDLVYEHDCYRDRDEGRAVLPDVIVHKRGVCDSNLLVIEMKKSGRVCGIEKDRRRIQAFRAQLGYEFGALVVCETGKESSIAVKEWYE